MKIAITMEGVVMNSLGPIQGACKAVAQLSQEHDVILLTHDRDKYREFRDFLTQDCDLGGVPLIVAGHQGGFCRDNFADLFITSTTGYAKAALTCDIDVILFYNADTARSTVPNGVALVYTWTETLNLIDKSQATYAKINEVNNALQELMSLLEQLD